MGAFKPLLPLGGRPMIVRAVESLAGAGVGPVLVVTGHRAGLVTAALADVAVSLVHNPDYQNGGMLSSVQAGVRALPPSASGLVLMLGDQPAVKSSSIRRLVESFIRSCAPIAIPTHRGRHGHPVVLAGRCIPLVLELAPDQTLKSLMTQFKNEILEVEVDDPAVLSDVDTPADYEAALLAWEQASRTSHKNGGAYAPQLG